MNQPPDDNFYNDSTENTGSPWQQRPGQAPARPQRPQAGPGNNPPPGPISQPGLGQQGLPPGQQHFPPGPGGPQGPLSQPGMGQRGFPAGQLPFPPAPNGPRGPVSQPGFPPGPGAPNFAQPGPISQPGLGQQGYPQQRFMSQPGIGQQNFSPAPSGPQGPLSQPGMGQQNFSPGPSRPQGPLSQPGIGQQAGVDLSDRTLGATSPAEAWDQQMTPPRSFAARELSDPSAPDLPAQRPSFPPPSGPISQPGFSTGGRPQADLYATEQAPVSLSNIQAGAAVPPWSQASPPEPPTSFAPWSQAPQPPVQPQPSAWQQPQQAPAWQSPPAAPASWPGQTPGPAPAPPAKPKSRLGLVITLAIVALIIIGGAGGIFLWRSHGSTPLTSGTPGAHGTAITNGVTPVPSRPAGTTPTPGGSRGIGTPVQAGTDWIVTITGTRETSSSLVAPNPGNIYLEVNLTLKNVSGKTLTLISILEFTLSGPNGQRWHETLGDTNVHRTPDGNVNANSTLTAQIAYEVPKSQHSFILIFAYGLNNNNSSTVSWQFNA